MYNREIIFIYLDRGDMWPSKCEDKKKFGQQIYKWQPVKRGGANRDIWVLLLD